jgi:hypothetical protein
MIAVEAVIVDPRRDEKATLFTFSEETVTDEAVTVDPRRDEKF